MDGEDLPNDTNMSQAKEPRDKITVITRRVLPALRQYSTWLVSRSRIITGIPDPAVKVHINELHKMYADVLTRLANFFHARDLPEVSYLLEEDETTIGFKPFQDPNLDPACNLYIDGDALKPRITDPGVERSHPNIEMLARVRDIMLCGLTLAVTPQYPITYFQETGEFMFVEAGLPPTSPVNGNGHRPSSSPTNLPHAHTSPTKAAGKHKAPEPPQQLNDEIESIADSHISMDTYMHNMVNSLLEPSTKKTTNSDETSYGMHSSTLNEVFAPTGQSGHHHHRQSQSISTPKVLPSLGGIWSSPFTPQPNELKSISPDRPSTARQLSPLQLATAEQQEQAAADLDEMTGFGTRTRNSWGRPAPQAVNQVLQESLAQQYSPLPMQSSAFSDTSSIYFNPTQAANRRSGGAFNHGQFSVANGNNTTTYAGASDFDRHMMFQSSLWNGSQPVGGWQGYTQTPPPGGQGG